MEVSEDPREGQEQQDSIKDGDNWEPCEEGKKKPLHGAREKKALEQEKRLAKKLWLEKVAKELQCENFKVYGMYPS